MNFPRGVVGFDLVDGGGGGVEVEIERAGGFEGASPVI
jgi:hypothetical protein